MSNYNDEADKLVHYLEELTQRHRDLDTELQERYNNVPATDEARRMKTMKLYLKDEMHRINQKLVQLGLS